MKKTITILIVLIIAAAAVIIAVTTNDKTTKAPSEMETLAQCITDSGATFFGAFWCPACIQQKSLFERKGSKLLPYQECSNPDRSMNAECSAAGIESYPTWEFADGERVTGVQFPADLAEKTGCVIPLETNNDGNNASTELEEGFSSPAITTEETGSAPLEENAEL